ncbi:hypothetical protein [Myceligenerans pegani]|uniref:Uncharacterized protein n=1 Tax=Myceligenerans pegani TaxID=2776917 RepID=A0ABR9MWZ2_9MICO|nr:hypothetical protein [Myceligenerans sp. TRM 65318]MBE1875895.1 hypothetical protein [Myceligenerans sp. TRM 65318]MBE3018166.1 hypothetical protein [Myceligenerans sp. TRM 65318]
MLHQHRARPRSRSMLLRVVLVLLAGIAAMILVNPSQTDFGDAPAELPGGSPTIGELVPFGR